MTLQRGDVVLVRFPHTSGDRGKKRPSVVVQADRYNAHLGHVILAQITTNLLAAGDPANFLIDLTTTEGQANGLTQDSVVSCLFLTTANADRTQRVGCLTGSLLGRLDACLRVALELP